MTLVLLLIYAEILGATSTGILLPETRWLTIILLLVLVIGWALIRGRLAWRWHRSPLDLAWLLWALVLFVSLLANLEDARRILPAMWYAGIYVALWVLLSDLLANRALTRDILVDIFLLCGVLMVTFGYIQIAVAAAGGQGFSFGADYDVRSLLINANALGTFLMVTLLLLLGRVVQTRALLSRLVLGVYFALIVILLYFTASRAAWLATIGGLFVWLLLLLLHYRFLSAESLTGQWRKLTGSVRAFIVAAGFLILGFAGLALSRFLITPLPIQLTLARRGDLLQVAMTMFAERPLTGYGLSSYGWHISRLTSMPPDRPSKNAHSFPFNLAGELGIIGLVAMLIILLVIVYAVYRNWRASSGSERLILTAGIAASVAYALHHLPDMTSASPMIALTGTLLLVIITAPAQPVPVEVRWQAALRSALLSLLWTTLLLTGFWDSQLNLRYMDVLTDGLSEDAYAETADNLQAITDADSGLLVYPAQQAFLWGLAAQDGDEEALSKAIAAYRRVIEMEAYYAPYYANLAALLWQADERETALEMMRRASDLAPAAWQVHYAAAMYAESLGQDDLARDDYAKVLAVEPDADLHQDWGRTTLQQAISSDFAEHSDLAQAVLLIDDGQIAEADEFWQLDRYVSPAPRHFIIREIIALAQDDHEAALDYYEQAQQAVSAYESDVWLLLGEARLAQYEGDDSRFEAAMQALEEKLIYTHDSPDGFANGADIAFYQYYRQTTVRQFLPQVFYPGYRPVLYHLIENT